MAECEKVCKYIDLPLQHASNAVLKRMKRPGHARRPTTRCSARIRDRVPGVALRTTFIVGFPGETEADVDELCGFVADHAFDHVGVFTYSHEEGTSALSASTTMCRRRSKTARRDARDGPAEAARRATRQRARIGERVRVLVDGPSAEHELVLQGRLATQAPDIDAVGLPDRVRPVALAAAASSSRSRSSAPRDYDLIARRRLRLSGTRSGWRPRAGLEWPVL